MGSWMMMAISLAPLGITPTARLSRRMDCWFTITAVLPKLVDLPWWSSLALLQRFLPKIDHLASSPAGSAVESYFERERYGG